MCGRCGEIKIGNEWICHDPYVQQDHAADPFDAFTKPTTNRSMKYFVEMIKSIEGKEWAAKVPTDLPIYNIAGDQDPVGMYGEDGISRFISDFVAHSSRRCPKIPPMTGRCMQTAVAL